MNVFKTLDSLFPTVPNRTFGEVVGITINVFVDGDHVVDLYEKRKAWYVNASVNAFHMHRSLVREFTETIRSSDLSSETMRRSKRFIALAVMLGYVQNFEHDTQYFTFRLNICSGPVGGQENPTAQLYQDTMQDGTTLLEVVDNGFGLAAIVTMSAIAAKERKVKRDAIRQISWDSVPYSFTNGPETD